MVNTDDMKHTEIQKFIRKTIKKQLYANYQQKKNWNELLVTQTQTQYDGMTQVETVQCNTAGNQCNTAHNNSRIVIN